MGGWTLVVSVGLLGLSLRANDVHGFHLGGIHFTGRKKVSSKTNVTIGPQIANIQPKSPMKIGDAKISIRKQSRPILLKVRSRRRRENVQPVVLERIIQKSFLPSVSLDVTEVDPWGVKYEQSHLELPSWALASENEARHLAAMKIVLKYDLEELSETTITTMDGRILKVVDAFPDVYGDLRMLRFLRKDKIQDPVTAALRYRQFLRWRTENHVDRIRLQLEERQEPLGHDHAFRPPASVESLHDCLPFRLSVSHAKDALAPVEIRLGQLDVDKLTQICRQGSGNRLLLQELMSHCIYIFEALSLHLYNESVRTKQMVLADLNCDFTGIRLGYIHPGFLSRVLRPLIHTAKSYYPETAVAIHYSHPSKVFSILWMIMPLFVK